MGVEIERKFLVRGEGWRAQVRSSSHIVQGYLAREGAVSVRVRIYDGARARLTLKSGGPGSVRAEFEYEIPVVDAHELIGLAGPHVIRKRRHLVPGGTLIWEVDTFEGRHEGLVLAEIELRHPEQDFARPDWLGKEVTDEERYYNSSLAGL